MKAFLALTAVAAMALTVGCTRRDNSRSQHPDTTADQAMTNTTADQPASSMGTITGAPAVDRTTADAVAPAEPAKTRTGHHPEQSAMTTGTERKGNAGNMDVSPGNTKVMGSNQRNSNIEQDFTNSIQKRVHSIDGRIATLKRRANQMPDEKKIEISSIESKREDLNAMMGQFDRTAAAKSQTDWETTKGQLAKAIDSLDADVKRAEGSMK